MGEGSETGARLAELLAALSLGIDLGFGQPMEHVLRQCRIAMRLCELADPIVGTSIIALRLWLAIGILGVLKHLWDKWEQGGSRPAVSH